MHETTFRGLGQQPCLSVIDKEWVPLNRWASEHRATQKHPEAHTYTQKHNPGKLQVHGNKEFVKLIV